MSPPITPPRNPVGRGRVSPGRIAILTGGSDCPRLNAVIRAVVKTAENVHGWEVFGVRDGFEAFLVPRGLGITRLDRRDIAGLLPPGGTIPGITGLVLVGG